MKYKIRTDDIRKIEYLVDEVCENYRLNDTYFGNILMALINLGGLVESNNNEKVEYFEIVIEKEGSLLIFNIHNNSLLYYYSGAFDMEEEGREFEAMFLVKALCDEIEVSKDAVRLIFDIGKVLEPQLILRQEEMQRYFKTKDISIKSQDTEK